MTRRFRAALREASTSITDLARAAGYSRAAFDQYANRRPPSVAAARALADALDGHAERLREHAARLREACSEAPGRGTT